MQDLAWRARRSASSWWRPAISESSDTSCSSAEVPCHILCRIPIINLSLNSSSVRPRALRGSRLSCSQYHVSSLRVEYAAHQERFALEESPRVIGIAEPQHGIVEIMRQLMHQRPHESFRLDHFLAHRGSRP